MAKTIAVLPGSDNEFIHASLGGKPVFMWAIDWALAEKSVAEVFVAVSDVDDPMVAQAVEAGAGILETVANSGHLAEHAADALSLRPDDNVIVMDPSVPFRSLPDFRVEDEETLNEARAMIRRKGFRAA